MSTESKSTEPVLKRARTENASSNSTETFATEPVSLTGALDGIDDVRVRKISPLLPPACLLEELPLDASTALFVKKTRREVARIIAGEDDRLLCIVGPCSIHDPKSAIEYAKKLKEVAEEFSKDLLIVMRVYFEKPRTTVGWKGLINDPDLNGTFKINKGLRTARKLLLEINSLGLGCGCEFLDALSPQFTCDLVSWGAIGARTTESQVHRELASGLSMPVGFKNGTGGDIQVAADAVKSAVSPHSFLSVTKQGVSAIVHTTGNRDAHIILRGGKDGPNYEESRVNAAAALAKKAGVHKGLMVDCSHGNSKKIHTNQPLVMAEIARQVAKGSTLVSGVMVESNLVEGKQSLKPGVTDLSTLIYGKSVTDACVNIPTTRAMMQELATAVQTRRNKQ